MTHGKAYIFSVFLYSYLDQYIIYCEVPTRTWRILLKYTVGFSESGVGLGCLRSSML